MKADLTFVIILRWSARIWSILSIALLTIFILGEGFNPTKVAYQEWIGFLFFPVGVVIGMVFSWREEVWGGLICILSLTAFYFIYSYLLKGAFPRGFAFIVISAPGFLFFLSGVLQKNKLQKPIEG